ncbi:MAG: hypothetical protein JW867_08530 [Candidatus Omnitrophica bacterium]|nr:hypothetical protein [Candidatus Omnitrophota bacterium]
MKVRKVYATALLKVLSLLFILSVTSDPAFAENFKIAYTGNSFSNLYPCGGCSSSVGGGITRRATALKQLGNKENLLLIDSGNFTGGGILDPNRLGPEEDKIRSDFTYQAMDLMGYDAVGLGINEFALGAEFLKKTIKTYKFKFISSNLDFEGVLPYYLKKYNGLEIGIIGLSSKDIYKEYGIEVKDYEESLKKALASIKGKCSIAVLISSIDENLAINLIKKFPEINVVISSGPALNSLPMEKVNDTILLRPGYEGRTLGLLNLEIKQGKIVDYNNQDIRLPLDMQEDIAVKKIIPECFSDQDCRSREGLVKKCQDAGAAASNCAYYAAEKIEATIVTDLSCEACSTELTETLLKDKFIGINFNRLDYHDKKAQDLIKRYQAETLPLFVIEKKIQQEKFFDSLSDVFVEHDDNFVLTPKLAGLFMFLDREEVKNKLDLFIDFYGKGTFDIYPKLQKFCSDNKIDFRKHFIISKDASKVYPLEEVKVALAVGRTYPDKESNYISLRIEQINQSSWVTTLDELGIDYKKILAESRSQDMDKLLEENSKLIKELGIGEGNVILINNNKIFKAFGIDEKLLKKMFKL